MTKENDMLDYKKIIVLNVLESPNKQSMIYQTWKR